MAFWEASHDALRAVLLACLGFGTRASRVLGYRMLKLRVFSLGIGGSSFEGSAEG